MDLKFQLSLNGLKFVSTIPSDINKPITGNYTPFLIIGFDQGIKQAALLKIPIDIKSKNGVMIDPSRIHRLIGKSKTDLIPYDTKMIFNLFILTENYNKVPAAQRLGETRIDVRDMLSENEFELQFKNKLGDLSSEITMKINKLKLTQKLEPKDTEKIQNIRENTTLINDLVQTHIQEWYGSFKELFKNFWNGTQNIFVLMDFNYNRFRMTTCYLTMYANETNERFWLKLMWTSIMKNWTEIAQGTNLKKPESMDDFNNNLTKIFMGLDKIKQVNVLCDMFTELSTNSVYLADFVQLKNGTRKIVEDFFNAIEGSDDCEGLSAMARYVQWSFKQGGPYKNPALKKLLQLNGSFIFFLALWGVTAGSVDQGKEGGKTGAHMNGILLSKAWLLNDMGGDDNEIIGRLLMNPLFKERNKVIKKQLRKLIQYEKDNGHLKQYMDSELIPNIAIMENTGLLNPSGQSNPLKSKYTYITSLFKSMRKMNLLRQMKSRIYHPVSKGSSPFFKYVIVCLTTFFVDHPIYPCNIPNITLTYLPEYNDSIVNGPVIKNKEAFTYGVRYVDLLNTNKNIRALINAPFPDLEKYMKLTKTLSKAGLKYNPLKIIGETTDKEPIFKLRRIDPMVKEQIPSPPNISGTITKLIHQDMEDQLKDIYPKMKIGHEPIYGELHDALTDPNRDVVYYLVHSIMFDKVKDDLIDVLIQHKQDLKLISVHKQTLLPNVSMYMIWIEII